MGLGGFAGLLLETHTAVYRADLECAGVCDGVGGFHDLRGQFTGGCEHQGGRARCLGGDAVDDRHHEGEGLARPGGRLGQHVAAGENVADHLGLDGEGRGESAIFKGAGNRARNAEIGEGLL